MQLDLGEDLVPETLTSTRSIRPGSIISSRLIQGRFSVEAGSSLSSISASQRREAASGFTAPALRSSKESLPGWPCRYRTMRKKPAKEPGSVSPGHRL